MPSWARTSLYVLVVAGVCAAPHTSSRVALHSGGALRYSVIDSKTHLRIQIAPGSPTRTITLERDGMVPLRTGVDKLQIIAELSGAIILTDSYASQPLGLSECQAGEERFLRVISLTARPRQTLRTKLASCRQNIELAESGVQWNSETSTLTIHWLQGPDEHAVNEQRAWKIGNDGSAAPAPEAH